MGGKGGEKGGMIPEKPRAVRDWPRKRQGAMRTPPRFAAAWTKAAEFFKIRLLFSKQELLCTKAKFSPTAVIKPHFAPFAARLRKRSKTAPSIPTFRGGGGGYIVGNQIIGNNTSISSSNTEHVHDRFFLVDEAAQQETDISLTDWNFPARAGNDVAFCWLIPQGAERGPYVYGINYSLNNERFLKNKLPRFNLLHRAPFKTFRFFAAVGGGLLGVPLCIMAIVCAAADSQYTLADCVSLGGAEIAYMAGIFGFLNVIFFLVGAVVSWLAVTWLTSFFLAGAINKGIAAEQQMRDEIRRLCREALAAKTEESL